MFGNTSLQKHQLTSGKPGIRGAWIAAWDERVFRLKLFLVPGLFVLYSAVTQQISGYIELQKGTKLSDTLLSHLPIIDCSELIFFLLYGSMATILVSHLDRPKAIIRILELQFIMALVRQLCILMIPLEPPTGMLILRDVFLENTFYPHHRPMTKDLFFSGHVACMWIYCLCAERRYVKICLGFATLAMSFMILSMRVHYTYDVYGAIFITTAIYSVHAYLSRPKLKEAAQPETVRVSV